MKFSIKGQGHSLTLVKGHSDFRVKCLTFGLYTQVSNSGSHGRLVKENDKNNRNNFKQMNKKNNYNQGPVSV